MLEQLQLENHVAVLDHRCAPDVRANPRLHIRDCLTRDHDRLYSRIANWLYTRGVASDPELELALRALANDRRLLILEWLKAPRSHFPPQVDGDLVEDGVCTVFLAEKLGVSQPTVSEHLRVLSDAGLVRGKRIKQWIFYKRDEGRIRDIKKAIQAKI